MLRSTPCAAPATATRCGSRSRNCASSTSCVEIDILKGETPHAGIPRQESERPRAAARGRARAAIIAESNAILWYVAGSTALAPEDRIDRAETLQWMFFEQHSLEPNIGAAYFWLALVKGGRELQQHALEDWMQEGYRALGVMEKHLTQHEFFAADRYTIADIALYAYTHLAHQCDYDLSRVSGDPRLARAGGAQPDHVAMDWQPAAALAAAQ